MSRKLKNILVIIVIPVIYLVLLRVVFGAQKASDWYSVMSIAFLFLVPATVGILTVYRADIEKVKKLKYRIIAPWGPVMVFLIISIVFTLEGLACWLMALPLFLIFSSIGGLVGGYFKLNKRNNRLEVSLLVLLPLLISPVEHLIGKKSSIYTVYTHIDINASANEIWENITSLETIHEEDDSGILNQILGFPRPLKAELDYKGVGGNRKGIFTNGLIFSETITEYEENKRMVFSIKANTYDIPPTTLDEHILIGGEYFDILKGTYRLEKIDEGKYRLHLFTEFKVNTTFNFYAGWWGEMILRDIQNNILRVEKKRSES